MAMIYLNPARSKGTINRNIYGHFSEHLGRCIYGGLFVGKNSGIPNINGMRTDVVNALKRIRVPVLRWPGGCFADEYHWEDGIGPQTERKRMVNTNWGGVVEDNSFGTHEFLELCEQIGCEPYINGNVGSGTVKEMSEWVEYLNSAGDSTVVQRRWANGRHDPWHVRFWGVGNESWGCGGSMLPEYYANEFRRYATFCRQYGYSKLYRIACGPNADDYNWMEVLMQRGGHDMDAITMHYYTLPSGSWEGSKGSATQFTVTDYYKTLNRTLKMDELIRKHSAIMDRYDPDKRVGLIVDEWGAWYDVEPGTNPGFLYQQNTMRDALIAGINLNIFNQHCDRVVMANLAQIVNVLQSVILTEGDQMVLTPTYHVFDLYQAHQDAAQIELSIDCGCVGDGEWQVPQLSASASQNDNVITVTMVNLSDCDTLEVELYGITSSKCTGRMLCGNIDDYNDFQRAAVQPKVFDAVKQDGEHLRIQLPACSVVELRIPPNHSKAEASI